MKNILTILLILCSFFAECQQKFPHGNIRAVDSNYSTCVFNQLILPLTGYLNPFVDSVGTLRYNPADSSLSIFTGYEWLPISSGDNNTGRISIDDTVHGSTPNSIIYVDANGLLQTNSLLYFDNSTTNITTNNFSLGNTGAPNQTNIIANDASAFISAQANAFYFNVPNVGAVGQFGDGGIGSTDHWWANGDYQGAVNHTAIIGSDNSKTINIRADNGVSITGTTSIVGDLNIGSNSIDDAAGHPSIFTNQRWLSNAEDNVVLRYGDSVTGYPYIAIGDPFHNANRTALYIDDYQQRIILNSDSIVAGCLTGTGNRMVVASPTGKITTQAIPSGTVTSIATGNGIIGGIITSTGTLTADTGILATNNRVRKLEDSLNANIAMKGSGTVTSITAGSGLSGGTITTSGTISLPTVNATPGLIGGSTAIPVFTTDAYGRITTQTTVSVLTPTFSNGLTKTGNNVTNDFKTGIAGNDTVLFSTNGGSGSFKSTSTYPTTGLAFNWLSGQMNKNLMSLDTNGLITLNSSSISSYLTTSIGSINGTSTILNAANWMVLNSPFGISFLLGGNNVIRINTSSFVSIVPYGLGSVPNMADLSFSRLSAGLGAIGNGTQGDFSGTLAATKLFLGGTTNAGYNLDVQGGGTSRLSGGVTINNGNGIMLDGTSNPNFLQSSGAIDIKCGTSEFNITDNSGSLSIKKLTVRQSNGDVLINSTDNGVDKLQVGGSESISSVPNGATTDSVMVWNSASGGQIRKITPVINQYNGKDSNVTYVASLYPYSPNANPGYFVSYEISSASGNIAINSQVGTWKDHQTLFISYSDNGTPRTITYPSNFKNSLSPNAITAATTTVAFEIISQWWTYNAFSGEMFLTNQIYTAY